MTSPFQKKVVTCFLESVFLSRAAAIWLALLAMAIVLTGCRQEMPQTGPDYAGPVTERMLVALTGDDYPRFAADFSDEMKKGLTESGFHKLSAAIEMKIGDYVSKEFWKVEKQDRFLTVYYRAIFTGEPDMVTVRALFQEIGAKSYVAGFWLDSPKLRQP